MPDVYLTIFNFAAKDFYLLLVLDFLGLELDLFLGHNLIHNL